MAKKPDEHWLAHALREAPWRTQTKMTSFVLILIAILVLMGVLYMAQASRTATAGREVQVLEARRDLLQQENDYLRAEIAALRSIPRLIAEAERLGYHSASPAEIQYVTLPGVPEPPSFNPAEQQLLAEFNEALLADVTASPIDPDETLGSWLRDQTASFRQGLREFFVSSFSAGAGEESE